MRCPIDSLDLSLYLDGEINPVKAARIRRHLARCPDCRARYEELAEVDAVLAFVDPSPGDADGAPFSGRSARGESAAARMPGRRRLSASERRTKQRRRRNTIAAAAAIAVTGAVLWWSADVPARTDRALLHLSDANRQRGERALEKACAIEARLAVIQTAILEKDLEPEDRDALERMLIELEETVTRLRAAARHATAGALPGAAPIGESAAGAPIEGAAEVRR